MNPSQVFFLRIAGLGGALAVVTGAFGAHGLEDRLDADMIATWEVGVRYHMYHAIALLAFAVAIPDVWKSAWAGRACWAWIAGTSIFSGLLYVLSLTGIRWLGAIVPLGGLLLITGWVMAALAAKDASAKDAS